MGALFQDRLADWTVGRNITLTLTLVQLVGLESEPSAQGYNWPTLFLGDINTGTWPSRLRESQIWDSKIGSRVPRDSDPRMTALARISSNCKRQTRSLVRESAPHQQTRNCLTAIKIWSSDPDVCLTPRQTGRLTVGRNITLTLTLTLKKRHPMWRWGRILPP
jgi:hypothetical protein